MTNAKTIFENILALDLSECEVTVCLASALKDESVPRFERLLISAELDELLNLADRIAVMFEGRIMGVVEPAADSVEKIGLMMAGIAEGGTSMVREEMKETRHGETL